MNEGSRMKRKLVLTLLTLVLSYFSIYAQNDCAADCSCSVSGVIKDAITKEPLPYTAILVKGTTKGIQTDSEGRFELSGLCSNEFDLVISFVGYKTITHHHDPHHSFTEVLLAPDEIILESIVVEGHHTETGMATILENTIDAKQLQTHKGEALGSILSSVTGVSTLKTGQNIIKPIIHGLHSNRILVVNNGIRHEGQGWGRQHASEIDPSLADNISVIKGAASVKYGPNALGGVVVVNPPELELTSHLHGEAVLRGESNGRAIDGNISLQKGYSRFVWMLQGAGRRQGDLQAANYNLTNTGMSEYSVAAASRYHRKSLDLTFYYSNVNQELGILKGSVTGNLEDLAVAMNASEPEGTTDFTYELSNPRQVTNHQLAKFEGAINLSKSQLLLTYAFQINERQEYDIRRGTNNDRPSIDLELYTHSVDAEWIHSELLNGWEGSIGGQWMLNDNNNLPGTNTAAFIPNYNSNRFGAFINESKTSGPFTYDLGLRYDYQTMSIRGRDASTNLFFDELMFQSVSGILGIKKMIGAYASLQSNLATAWRPPNIAELYAYGKHESIIEYGLWRFDQQENGDINTNNVLTQDDKPVGNEIGYKWINNYSYNKDRLRLDAVLYINYINNYVYSRPYGVTSTVRGAFPYYIFDQTDALFTGLDATLLYEYNYSWKSTIKGSYITVRDIKNDDRFIGIPANRISHELGYSVGNLGWCDELNVNVETMYQFKQYEAPQRIITATEFDQAVTNETNLFLTDNSNFDFREAPDGYFLMNVGVELTMDNFVVGLRGTNLLNQEYREYTNLMRYFSDEQGLNVLLSIRMQL